MELPKVGAYWPRRSADASAVDSTRNVLLERDAVIKEIMAQWDKGMGIAFRQCGGWYSAEFQLAVKNIPEQAVLPDPLSRT